MFGHWQLQRARDVQSGLFARTNNRRSVATADTNTADTNTADTRTDTCTFIVMYTCSKANNT
jgi:hypothetical protein